MVQDGGQSSRVDKIPLMRQVGEVLLAVTAKRNLSGGSSRQMSLMSKITWKN